MRVTLDKLDKATPQQVFDFVVGKLLKQNQKSQEDGFCVFKDTKGNKCAAGWLLTNEDYKRITTDPNFEKEKTWDALVINGIVPHTHENLIRELQIVHDSHQPQIWTEKFNKLAEKLNLKFNY